MLRLCLWMLWLHVGLTESCPTGVQTHIGRGTKWTHFPGFDRLEDITHLTLLQYYYIQMNKKSTVGYILRS